MISNLLAQIKSYYLQLKLRYPWLEDVFQLFSKAVGVTVTGAVIAAIVPSFCYEVLLATLTVAFSSVYLEHLRLKKKQEFFHGNQGEVHTLG